MYSATEGKALTPSAFREYVGVEPPPEVRLTERTSSIRNCHFESGSDVSDHSGPNSARTKKTRARKIKVHVTLKNNLFGCEKATFFLSLAFKEYFKIVFALSSILIGL
jgi:hypothetical protein